MSILEEIKNGESRILEFKEIMPESLKIMKTAAAFSNGAGGKLIIGVKDKTSEIVGISKNDVVELPDKITNIIFDGCFPNIIPEIYSENVDGKNILVIEFYPGNLKPYYIKSYGKVKGSYIRVGATNKPADIEMINELERQRRNISYDEEILYNIENLNLGNVRNSLSNKIGRSIEQNELLTLKLLKEENGKMYPTRGFMLLLGNNIDFEFARIKCARFKGDDVEEFIDQKVFSGILYEQVDNAINFAKTHISKSGVIKDIKREDNYAIPILAIREAIINAVVHRDYSITGSDIKFAIFDNRVEITSPGVLPKTLSINDIKSGKSEIRNKVIARIFSEINYIEQWGTGIRRIIAECKKNSLIEPIFEESGLFFKVTIFNLSDNNKTPINDDKMPISDDKTPISDDKTGTHKKINEFSVDEKKVITYLKDNEYITNSIARELIGKKDTATKNLLNKLVKKEIIIAIGERKNRIYKMNGK